MVERHFLELLVGHRHLEAVAERLDGRGVHLLLLVGDVHRLAGGAQAIALDRLGEDHRRLALVRARRVIRRIDLVRVVAAAVEVPDVLVGQARHQLAGFLVLAEELVARVGAAEGLVVLVFAVERFHHQVTQLAAGVARQQRIPVAAPQQLDHVPARAAEHAFEFLHDLAVAAHRAIKTLQVAVDHEHQVVQALAAGQRDRAQRFGLVGLAVTHEQPDLAVGLGHQAAVLEVLPEARLVDGGDRPQAHRHGRRLPEVGHQPRMRIRGDALAVDLHPEMVELAFVEAALEPGPRVDARCTVALDVQQVAADGRHAARARNG